MCKWQDDRCNVDVKLGFKPEYSCDLLSECIFEFVINNFVLQLRTRECVVNSSQNVSLNS